MRGNIERLKESGIKFNSDEYGHYSINLDTFMVVLKDDDENHIIGVADDYDLPIFNLSELDDLIKLGIIEL